jgi:hypothetical protein
MTREPLLPLRGTGNAQIGPIWIALVMIDT